MRTIPREPRQIRRSEVWFPGDDFTGDSVDRTREMARRGKQYSQVGVIVRDARYNPICTIADLIDDEQEGKSE